MGRLSGLMRLNNKMQTQGCQLLSLAWSENYGGGWFWDSGCYTNIYFQNVVTKYNFNTFSDNITMFAWYNDW